MEAEAGTLESLVLFGELCEPGKSRPKVRKKNLDIII